ncbi:MAG: hypothetical protein CMI29_03860 [Opitutae bacterium]|mgnify:CR=1 FL=1|nr:hypothetical protein [Opitutae bacterium]
MNEPENRSNDYLRLGSTRTKGTRLLGGALLISGTMRTGLARGALFTEVMLRTVGTRGAKRDLVGTGALGALKDLLKTE